MTENIVLNGKEIWINIEPFIYREASGVNKECFTATYYLQDPATNPGGILLLDAEKRPILFNSPMEALEYSSEKLLSL